MEPMDTAQAVGNREHADEQSEGSSSLQAFRTVLHYKLLKESKIDYPKALLRIGVNDQPDELFYHDVPIYEYTSPTVEIPEENLKKQEKLLDLTELLMNENMYVVDDAEAARWWRMGCVYGINNARERSTSGEVWSY